MGRWEPNARERLEQAAIELFLQHGYDNTTVAQIAERAGLTKSTFFRHYTDKREVLFGREELIRFFSDAITGAPESATPIEVVGAALDALAEVFGPERHEWAEHRQDVISGNSELQERELLKMARLTEAVSDALRKRGVTDPTASLVAEIGVLAFRNAYARWAAPKAKKDFAKIAHEELDGLRVAITALS